MGQAMAVEQNTFAVAVFAMAIHLAILLAPVAF